MAPVPPCGATEVLAEVREGIRIEVPEVPALERRPEVLDGVSLRRVGGEPFDGEPSLLGGEECPRFPGPVTREPIPEEHDPPAEVPTEHPDGLNRIG